ncbi:EamA family transporter [Streptomyces harbinensis]|uniref:DMT family transporter n=2 Tax=Streptomyces harbinensis TaxID=1176198 RepID=UPI001590B249|nr:EamA family transporter [Streptomyces harbinensis]QKV67471.1 EamA family transporter [Streptomyces harbinensis]
MSSTASPSPSSATAAPAAAAPPAPGTRGPGGPLLILAAATLWGTTGTVASFAPAGASPLAIGAGTMGIGGLLTLALAGRSVLAVLRSGRRALGWALLGALGIVIYPLAFYTSMAWAGVAVGTVVSLGCAPVFAALLERILDGTRLTRRWAAAAGAAGGGCALLVAAGGAGGGDTARISAGVALGLLAGAAYAGYTYYAGCLIRRGHSSRAVMGALFGLGTLVLVPLFALTSGPLLVTGRGLLVVGYLALVPMCLAYLLFGAGLVRVRASAATVLTLFEPVVAAVLGVAVVGERLGVRGWSGVALVVAGLLVLTVRRR